MRLQGREISPTRATQLALRDEQKLIREGYEFLDEKRMLLAQELLRQLSRYSDLKADREQLRETAKDALVQASMRHGLEDLSIYPAPMLDTLSVSTSVTRFLGLHLVEASLTSQPQPDDEPKRFPAFPSLEAEDCAKAYRALLEADIACAAANANLHRLTKEYVQTEQRARALENVLLPEIAEAVKDVGEHLEAEEQEEAIQLRHIQTR